MQCLRKFAIPALAALVFVVGSGVASAQGVGIKGGVVFPSFDADEFDFDNAIGWQAGIFVGGSNERVVSFQAEFNYLNRKSDIEVFGQEIASLTTHTLQVPTLLRLNGGTDNFDVYGIVGPSFEVKFAETIKGVGFEETDDAFETIDVALMFGAGIEIGPVILEGRYSKGLRSINRDLQDIIDLKQNSFAALVGVRF
jgi:hypothetical protein